MRIERHFTKSGKDAYKSIDFKKIDIEMKNPDGSVVFDLKNVEVPAAWSQVACDVLVQKYFRKAGIASKLRKNRRKHYSELVMAILFQMKTHWQNCQKMSVMLVSHLPNNYLIAWLVVGLIGVGKAVISIQREMQKHSLTKCAPCSPCKWQHLILRNGLIRDYIGHTVLTDHLKGIFTLMTKTKKLTKSKSAYERPQPHALLYSKCKRRSGE